MQTAYFVNAFISRRAFSGNPAAVCLLDEWPEDRIMQNVAAQHNLSETAFLVEMAPATYAIRWFTPQCEVDLCGHATLASAHILFEYFLQDSTSISFQSASGELIVRRHHSHLTLDFPLRELAKVNERRYESHFSVRFAGAYSDGFALMLVCQSERQVRDFVADHTLLSGVDEQIIYLTASGSNCDFVCRVFAPKLGVLEDPVTGSAYTSLAPYWSTLLDRKHLTAHQLSRQGGLVAIELSGDRVLIGGEARTIMIGQWMVEPSDSI